MTAVAPLYMRVMGNAWTRLSPPIRRVHAAQSVARAHGRLRIEHGSSPGVRLVARILRLPRPGAAAETRLIVTSGADGELWQRTFDGRRFATRQYESPESMLAERFGILEFRFCLEASGGSLRYVQREAAIRFGRIRMRIPAVLAPHVEAREDPGGPHSIALDVRVILPAVGLLFAYSGIIDVEDGPA